MPCPFFIWRVMLLLYIHKNLEVPITYHGLEIQLSNLFFMSTSLSEAY